MTKEKFAKLVMEELVNSIRDGELPTELVTDDLDYEILSPDTQSVMIKEKNDDIWGMELSDVLDDFKDMVMEKIIILIENETDINIDYLSDEVRNEIEAETHNNGTLFVWKSADKGTEVK